MYLNPTGLVLRMSIVEKDTGKVLHCIFKEWMLMCV
jgi:hypothetical protein